MNSTVSKMTEFHYLLLDLIPIGISFGVGFVTLVILVVLEIFGKYNNGNTLIAWLYGGYLTRVEKNGRLFIDNIEVPESKSLRVLRSLLVANAVTLATLLTMIFCDTFFVKSDFDLGCLENLDCYMAENDPPLNCSHFFNQDEKIACYQLKLDFFQAFADAGGVLSVATLGVVVMTKIWIYYGKNSSGECTNVFVLYICKCVVLTGLVGIVIAVHVLMYIYTRESYTILRELGIIFKFVAVGVSIIITTITPWFLLERNPVFNINVNLVNDELIKVTVKLDVNPVLKLNCAQNELVLKVQGNFNEDPVLQVKGELNIIINNENPIIQVVQSELNVIGNLTVNGDNKINPILDVSGQLDAGLKPVFIETGILNVKPVFNLVGQLNVIIR